jgi:DNA-directed RNA polymerase subunit RPC12/RpoP
MPVPEEFVKKRTGVTISEASLKALSCRSCGAAMDHSNIAGVYAKCAYCGHPFTLDVEGASKA